MTAAGRRRFFAAASLLLATLAACERRPTEATPTDRFANGAGGPHFIVTAGQYASFYIHAHQDDWQVFMGDRANASLQSSSQVTFVYTTAGDGGQAASFWQTRELAARAAIDALLPAGAWTCTTQVVNGHGLHRCAKANAVSYDMRLPDGAASGEGYLGRGSLNMLRDGQVTSLTAIDGSTTYTSWTDFVLTLRGIVDLEGASQSAPYIDVHAPESDRTANPGDHPDHYSTADAMVAAAVPRNWNISWYVDYNTQNLAVNLSQTQHDIKQNAFYAYDNYMGAAGLGRNQYESNYQAWLWRTYYRSQITTPVPPPATPTALTATAASATTVNLTWTDNATNETGYTVERAPDVSGVPGTFAQIASLAANSTSYSNTALTSGTTYWYRVRAFNATDISAYSNQISATTLIAPAAPTALAGTAMSTTRIDLTWVDNATNETGYTVERAPDVSGAAGTYAPIATLAANTQNYSDTGLSGSTRYWYRVRAFNTTDQSAYATSIAVTTLVGPAAPTNLTATATSTSQISLTWTDNATNETGYSVERAPDVSGTAGSYAVIASLAANSTSYGDGGLAAGTRYWYRVRAVNGVDVSAYSTAANATTLPTPPAAPTNLQATAMSSSRIDLAWTDNATNESGYSVERAPDVSGAPGTFGVIASLGAGATSYSSTGLTAVTRYWYRVRATNAGGNSAYTANASATTLSAPTTRTDFYIHAHEDDWQLFMGDHANNSYSIATKQVFVYMSAGDAGRDATFWHSRENAATASMDALSGTSGGWTCGTQTVSTHPILRCTKGKLVSYFMRVPDGGMSGEGFLGHGSLAYLRDGQIASITTIDGSTTYRSWTDFVTTMRSIVDIESNNASAPLVEVNAPEIDRSTNINDHPDHLATGDAVNAAAATRSWNLTWYIDYYVQYMPVNISQATHDVKQTMFYAYDNYMGSLGYGRNQYEPEYQAWLWRTYTRQQFQP